MVNKLYNSSLIGILFNGIRYVNNIIISIIYYNYLYYVWWCILLYNLFNLFYNKGNNNGKIIRRKYISCVINELLHFGYNMIYENRNIERIGI